MGCAKGPGDPKISWMGWDDGIINGGGNSIQGQNEESI